MKHSDSITNITKALLTVQKTVGGVMKDASNPYFKSRYATLEAVIEVIKGPLNDNGILFFQTPGIGVDGKTVMTTRLIHSSGEWIEGEMNLLMAKEDPQGQGSAISYARRYMLNSMIGLYQEDDDGSLATFPRKPEVKAQAQPEAISDELTGEQVANLVKIKSSQGGTKEGLYKLVGEWSDGKITTKEGLNRISADKFIHWCLDIKKVSLK